MPVLRSMRRQRVDAPLAETDLARFELGEARDHAQKRGLAAARWAEQREELAIRDGERDVMDGVNRAEGSVHAMERDAGQDGAALKFSGLLCAFQRVSWMRSLSFSKVSERFSVQPLSS